MSKLVGNDSPSEPDCEPTPRQGGDRHINLHSNEYVVGVFEELGYTRDLVLEGKLRDPVDNFRWFENSAMAFRRIKTAC